MLSPHNVPLVTMEIDMKLLATPAALTNSGK